MQNTGGVRLQNDELSFHIQLYYPNLKIFKIGVLEYMFLTCIQQCH